MRRTPGGSNVLSLTGRDPGPSSPQRDLVDVLRVDEPLAAAAAALRAAEAATAKAEGTVRVAQARLAEARDAAPRVSPRVAIAERESARAASLARAAAQAVTDARRAVADSEGALEAARAAEEDLAAGFKKSTPGLAVAARVKVEKASRAETAARDRLTEAEEEQASSEALLTAAEQRAEQVRAEPPPESAKVVAAEIALEEAERSVRSAQETQAAKRMAYEALRRATNDGRKPAAPAVPHFASLDTFVEEYLLPAWRHPLRGEVAWCARWWAHAEAVTRLEALWEAFEASRLQAAPALSAFWRDHVDPHMRSLTAKDGTFAGCAATPHETEHLQGPEWIHEPVPVDVFGVDPDAPVQPRRVRAQRNGAAS